MFVRRAAERSRGLVPLATHDTKRGAETRARLNALALQARAWIEATERWRSANRHHRAGTADAPAPDAMDEWLIYQTLAATWPIETERLTGYLTKALREAKRHTSWEEPAAGYESATQRFAEALLEAPDAAGFRTEMAAVVTRLLRPARINAVAQTILQLTVPGTPDLYQGTELWDHSLVDPDNRRPVDWDLRRRLLAQRGVLPAPEADTTGITKLATIHALLELRRNRPALFLDGDYRPLPGLGQEGFGFIRSHADTSLLVLVPLRGAPTAATATEDAAGRWRDAVSGRDFELAHGSPFPARADWPFTVAIREGRSGRLQFSAVLQRTDLAPHAGAA